MNREECINVLKRYTGIEVSRTVNEAHEMAIAAVENVLTTEKIIELDRAYLDKCQEVNALRKKINALQEDIRRLQRREG